VTRNQSLDCKLFNLLPALLAGEHLGVVLRCLINMIEHRYH